MADDPLVLVEAAAPVARITLNRPQRRNPLSLAMLDALGAAIDTVAASEARIVVVAGNGPVFSAGHDIAEMAEHSGDDHAHLFSTCSEVMQRLQAMPQPTIARVHGVATAAGCQLVAACDLAVATTSARFATPGVRIGLFCSVPMVPVSRAVGRKRALEMLFTGEMIDAPTALEWGLVNRVVPDEELDAAIDDLCAPILRASAEVVALGKRTFYAQEALSEPDAYGATTAVMSDNAGRPVAREGFAAFLGKRDPVWPS
jgi:enoyl-CoA hydratase/carnithine racemase